MKDLWDLKDLTIHDIKPIRDESTRPCSAHGVEGVRSRGSGSGSRVEG